MTRFSGIRYAYRHIRTMAREYQHNFEKTKSARIAETYGVETELVKRIKARFRCELSFGEGK